RGQAGCDGRPLRLRRFGSSCDSGDPPLGMPRVCHEPGRTASRPGERAWRRMDRQRGGSAAGAAGCGNFVCAGGEPRAAGSGSARSRRHPGDRGNLSKSNSGAGLRKTSLYEKELRSVTANTRADGEEFLKLAGAIPVRTSTVAFGLAEANVALKMLKHDEIKGAGVLRIS